jgi:hypothetical protein
MYTALQLPEAAETNLCDELVILKMTGTEFVPSVRASRTVKYDIRAKNLSHKTSRYCWPTPFKVLEVLSLGEIYSAFWPSKMACWAHQFCYLGVGQQYPSLNRDTTLLSQHNSFGLHCEVWVVDCESSQAYKVCVSGHHGKHGRCIQGARASHRTLGKPRHGILYASASLRRLAFLRWKGL